MARRRKNEKRQKSIRYFDYSLLFLIIFLLCFGLIMLYSTSSYYGSTRFNDAAYYVKRQMYASALGIVAMLFISRIPYKFWMQLSTLAYFVALVLCTAVIFVGTSAKGQSRWLRIGPIQFQPSEIAKIAVIIFLATIIYKTPKRIGEIMSLLKIMLLISPVLAVVAYNNLSTAIIILGIAVCMLFVASPKYLQFILMGIGVCLFGALFILLASYRAERVMIWLHPEDYEKGYQTLQGLYAIGSGGLFGKGLGESMQKLGFIPEAQNDMIFSVICEELGLFGAVCLIPFFIILRVKPDHNTFRTVRRQQGLYAIGSGGLFGKGLGESMQKLGFIPEAQNDMIFSVICEELGLFGAVCLILLYLLIIWRLMIIANNASDLYGALIVVGIMAHLSIQVLLNIAVVTNTIPNTGVSLPFISYGGTSISILLAEMGLALSVSRGIKLEVA